MALVRHKKIIIALLLLMSFVITPFFGVNTKQTKADLVDEIENEIEEKNDQVKNLENQAEAYKDIIYNLRIEEQSLENEIELLDAQIAQLDLEIKATQAQIDQANLEINNLILRIQIKEGEIEKQKEFLKSLIREINDYDKKTALEIFLKNEELSDFLNQAEYADTVGEKIKNALDKLKEIKEELEEEKVALQDKKAELEELNKKFLNKKEIADTQKTAKETLLEETKGKEYKYQDLLFNVRNQRKTILGDMNKLRREMKAEVARIAALAERPSENLASTSWYFSQNDPRWKNNTIGFSSSSIDDYGCAISSVAMVYKYYGINIDPGRLAKQPIYYRDLIYWPNQWRFLDLVKHIRRKPGKLTKNDWNTIDRQIAGGHPVIVFIRALGRGAGHYVVIHSKDSKGYIVHDPVMWSGQSGANIYLSTTRKYIESIYKTNTVIDQMIVYN
ncbi:MAG: C39 family peptidase [Patescibacteria group bacterium]|nr:C39 family peptidase [Patescibacteria group bacterium]